MPVRALILATSISLAIVYGARAQDEDSVVDTPEDVQEPRKPQRPLTYRMRILRICPAEALTAGRTLPAHKTTAATFNRLR